MRAATAIVGAIAASSVLIALAFLLPGGDSGQAQATRTITEVVEASKAKRAASGAPAGESGAAHLGGPIECAGGELSVENVSCEVGEQVHRQYVGGARGEFVAIDKELDETVTMTCGQPTPVICTGPGGAKVYFEP
jgi:hypothetical protein